MTEPQNPSLVALGAKNTYEAVKVVCLAANEIFEIAEDGKIKLLEVIESGWGLSGPIKDAFDEAKQIPDEIKGIGVARIIYAAESDIRILFDPPEKFQEIEELTEMWMEWVVLTVKNILRTIELTSKA
jgi:hypothetical protein